MDEWAWGCCAIGLYIRLVSVDYRMIIDISQSVATAIVEETLFESRSGWHEAWECLLWILARNASDCQHHRKKAAQLELARTFPTVSMLKFRQRLSIRGNFTRWTRSFQTPQSMVVGSSVGTNQLHLAVMQHDIICCIPRLFVHPGLCTSLEGLVEWVW